MTRNETARTLRLVKAVCKESGITKENGFERADKIMLSIREGSRPPEDYNLVIGVLLRAKMITKEELGSLNKKYRLWE